MSLRIYYNGHKRSLSTALKDFRKKRCPTAEKLIVGHFQSQFDERVDKPNEGWLCVYGNAPLIARKIRPFAQSFEYVFWDSQRLREADFRIHGMFEDSA